MHWRLMNKPDVFDDSATRCLLSVVERGRGVTFRQVAEDAGIPLSTTYSTLLNLRALGLVAWEDGHRGTMRPLVEVVAVP